MLSNEAGIGWLREQPPSLVGTRLPLLGVVLWHQFRCHRCSLLLLMFVAWIHFAFPTSSLCLCTCVAGGAGAASVPRFDAKRCSRDQLVVRCCFCRLAYSKVKVICKGRETEGRREQRRGRESQRRSERVSTKEGKREMLRSGALAKISIGRKAEGRYM